MTSEYNTATGGIRESMSCHRPPNMSMALESLHHHVHARDIAYACRKPRPNISNSLPVGRLPPFLRLSVSRLSRTQGHRTDIHRPATHGPCRSLMAQASRPSHRVPRELHTVYDPSNAPRSPSPCPLSHESLAFEFMYATRPVAAW